MTTIGTINLHIGSHRYKVRRKPIHTGTHSERTVMTLQPDIDFDEIFKALAHPVRREMLVWLKTPHEFFVQEDHPFEIGVCAGKFDHKTGLSQSTVSGHLASLQRAGLVTSRKVGQWNFFKRNEDTIAAFITHLSHAL
jgi:ArsR family transcriptional regulator